MRTHVLRLATAAGAVLFALSGVSQVGHGTRPGSKVEKERGRLRTLRQRFQGEFERAGIGETRTDEGIGERDAFNRWFFEMRAYPGTSLPEGAVGRAFLASRTRNSDALDAAPAAEGVWQSIGPLTIPDGQTDESLGVLSPVSGRVTAIATHPTDPDIVYVGGAQGGVWKTTQATGAKPLWKPLTDTQPSLAVGAIAIDPVHPEIIYVGTGEPNRSCDSYYGQGILRSTDGGKTWTVLGGGGSPLSNPGPFVGKAVARIIVDPATAGSATSTTLWASTTIGVFSGGTIQTCSTPSSAPFGLWRSKDSGQTWQLQNVPTIAPGAGNFSVQDMALDPVDHETLYAAVRSDGVWKSTNAATGSPATFTKVATGFPVGSAQHPLRRINVSIGGHSAPGTLYAAVENGAGSALFGLFKTTDGGASWANVDAGFNGTANVTAGSKIVNRTGGASFVTDGTWTGRRFIVNGQYAMSIQTVNNANQLVLTANYPGATGAANWSTGNYPRYCDGQCFYDMTVAVDPSDAHASRVYVGGNPHTFAPDLSGVPGGHYNWRTDDGGLSWRAISQGDGLSDSLHTDDHAYAFGADGAVYDGNDGGIWRSTDQGASWSSLNTNLVITQFQGVSTHPHDKAIVLGGTQDNGTNLLNSALQPPPVWFHSDFGDGGQSLIDQSTPLTMYHTYFNQSFNFMGPAKSTNGGASGPGTWDFVGAYYGYQNYGDYYNGMDPTDPVSFYAPLAEHPAFTPNVIYFGSNKVYRSPNPLPTLLQTPSWTPVSPALTKGGSAYLSWIAPHPTLVGGKEVIYTGASDGAIAVSKDVDGSGIANWTRIDLAPLPNRAVSGLATISKDPSGNAVLACFSGFNGSTPTTPGHLFVTVNGLAPAPTWVDVSGDLPDIPCNAVVVDYVHNQPVVYVATDIGVFRSRNNGKNWHQVSHGLPFVAVFGLERNATTGQIVAATHGRGMFHLVKP